jgi:dienelactone hydrolase
MNRRNLFADAGIIIAIFFIAACNNEQSTTTTEQAKTETPATKETEQPTAPKLKEENITYEGDGATMYGFVAYDTSYDDDAPSSAIIPKPAVLVIHEWWGLNDYTKMRARELAKLGYVAMAIDLFGNGQTAANPQEAMIATTPFYKDPQKAKRRFDAAMAKLKSYRRVDQNKIAAIGYCFGGNMVLKMATMGEDLKAVVSFHGGLDGITPNKEATKAQILICHGSDDSFVPKEQVNRFRKQFDSVGTPYTFKAYPGATHAFTNPGSTETGKKFSLPIAYNPAADSASWKDMREFFDQKLK